ncbi:hypothetical protein GLYMA_09G174500v4 [Glycine max]|uniref:Uncharacterized protein n=1 Tax=Glycine max TaxID=3847 RepID=A0A0R0IH83_SOYBN|nr:hypothetical protein GYH30_025350 [Glycine max]KRH39051.1 hypothetical protein GLYMA_09G174500v4 [Glycine max]
MHCCSFNMGLSVEPHGKCVVAFSLAWPSPKVNFVKGSTFWRRYGAYLIRFGILNILQ